MFIQFKKKLQKHVAEMLQDQQVLFVTDVDKDKLWEIYLESFPSDTNEIFRERREHDCSCCRHFIKSFGNVVVIKDNEIMSIWNFNTDNSQYQPVIDVLNDYVISKPIKDVFIIKDLSFQTDHNFEQLNDGTAKRWDHFSVDLSKRFINKSADTIDTIKGKYRDTKSVFKRSLEEISNVAIATVLELIAQKSLYKGEEWEGALTEFFILHNAYHIQENKNKDIFCWIKSVGVGGAIAKIKNHSIGVLLLDITSGMDLNEAVKRYEKIVAPINYKRPKEIFTKKMIEQAEKTITELGFLDSLGRRYANIDDITINNILFANKDTTKKLGGIFQELKQEAITNIKNFDRVEEVNIETFVKDILPKVSNIELYLENKLEPNLVSLVAPQNNDSKTMFKWNNNFSWAYNGNITDSMKQMVKALGGNVDGVLRFSIQWNEKFDNQNDFDAHCYEPNGNIISYPKKAIRQPSSGMLDVDIITPGNKVAVENIIYTDINAMPEGIYDFLTYVYSYREGKTGFCAEIEFDNQIYTFEYRKNVRQGEKIKVAKVKYTKTGGFKIIESLQSNLQSKTIWKLNTNNFHTVSTIMFSPNYWDQQKGIGHKHYFFMLNGCSNETAPNGFFNEFLKEDLLEHKRVFAALGSKMRVKQSNNQLSGLGFSSTQRNSVICKLSGNFARTIKLIF